MRVIAPTAMLRVGKDGMSIGTVVGGPNNRSLLPDGFMREFRPRK